MAPTQGGEQVPSLRARASGCLFAGMVDDELVCVCGNGQNQGVCLSFDERTELSAAHVVCDRWRRRRARESIRRPLRLLIAPPYTCCSLIYRSSSSSCSSSRIKAPASWGRAGTCSSCGCC